MLHDEFFVDHGCDAGLQCVQHQNRRKLLGDRHLHMIVVHNLDELIDVVFVPTELGDDECRGLVELDDTLQRVSHILGGDRVAGVESQTLANLEGDGFAIATHFPAFGHTADQLGEIFGFEHHHAVIEIGGDFATGQLEHFCRVQGDDVADVLRHDEGALGCFGLNRGNAREGNGGQRQ